MTKLNLKETVSSPSNELIEKANQPVTVTDARGRVITLKKPSVLAQYRLVEMVGGDTAANQTYMTMIMPLMFITKIDEEFVIAPQTKRELEALIQLLDEDGITAVNEKMLDVYGASDPEKDKEALKN